LLSLALAAPATSQAAEVRPVLVAGYDTGGAKIAEVSFTTGETDSLTANEGVYLGAGVSVLNDDRNIEFLGAMNVKYVGIHASNGNVEWTRFPVDALVFYRTESFRIGAGVTYVIGPRLTGSGPASSINAIPDNAFGGLVQADYLMGKVALGLRYTFLDYKIDGNSYRSDGVGISFGFTF
jgi:hypothetical protein